MYFKIRKFIIIAHKLRLGKLTLYCMPGKSLKKKKQVKIYWLTFYGQNGTYNKTRENTECRFYSLQNKLNVEGMRKIEKSLEHHWVINVIGKIIYGQENQRGRTSEELTGCQHHQKFSQDIFRYDSHREPCKPILQATIWNQVMRANINKTVTQG